MQFNSTRNKELSVSASKAITQGLSEEGGLFVPEAFPRLSADFVAEMEDLSYSRRAAKIIGLYLTDYDADELQDMCDSAYQKFDGEPAPVVKLANSLYVLELWHGETAAFKDMALSLLPYLLVGGRKKQGISRQIKVLVATSGDTGKAALEGFKDVAGTTVTVFYPSEGVSDIQKLQMMTQEGENVSVCGVKGNFDDCQSAVKRVFESKEIAAQLSARDVVLSSANSINFGRLVPQIVYYISAYVDLVSSGEIKAGDPVNFAVPTGNFGNILAAYYAKRMGLNIHKLICASNSNNVLTDFFDTGCYDMNRKFHKTMSPSMDILLSSNLERLIYEFSGRDAGLTVERMEAVKKTGKYSVTKAEIEKLDKDFYAGYAGEEETGDAIEYFFDEYGYLCDPHTAVAAGVYNEYRDQTDDSTPTVIVSTASPYKFAQDVYEVLGEERLSDAFKAIQKLYELSAMEIPPNIAGLKKKTVRFKDVVSQEEIFDRVLK